jgi:predicted GIY-YIG superfamily endonuclease
MHEKFQPYVEELESKLQQLLSMKPKTPLTLPRRMPQMGVYLFSEEDKHLYVGRTRRLKQRIKEQANILGAPFGFRLAREETGFVTATYMRKGSRDDLFLKPEFAKALEDAQKRIRNMNVQYVEVTDPIKQTLLEVYVAVVLETPHNKFETS